MNSASFAWLTFLTLIFAGSVTPGRPAAQEHPYGGNLDLTAYVGASVFKISARRQDDAIGGPSTFSIDCIVSCTGPVHFAEEISGRIIGVQLMDTESGIEVLTYWSGLRLNWAHIYRVSPSGVRKVLESGSNIPPVRIRLQDGSPGVLLDYRTNGDIDWNRKSGRNPGTFIPGTVWRWAGDRYVEDPDNR